MTRPVCELKASSYKIKEDRYLSFLILFKTRGKVRTYTTYNYLVIISLLVCCHYLNNKTKFWEESRPTVVERSRASNFLSRSWMRKIVGSNLGDDNIRSFSSFGNRLKKETAT